MISITTDESNNRIISNVICTGCGLLCDDIHLEVNAGALERCVNACERGFKKLQYYLNELAPIECQRRPDKTGSETVSYDEAISDAAAILQQSKMPLCYGFASSSLEDQQAILKLAEKLGAQFASPALITLNTFYEKARENPLYIGTLGEAINKGDVFVFWDADPLKTHPRLVSKVIYSRGFFRITGYEVKKYVVVHPSDPDKFRGTALGLQVPPELELATIEALRESIAAGTHLDPPAGIDKAAFWNLVSILINGEYIIFFLDKNLLHRENASEIVTALSALVAELNQKERAMFLPLAEDLNSMGIFQHLLATGQFPPATVDWDQVDALILGGVEETTEIPAELLTTAKKVPVIFLQQEEMMLAKNANVILPVTAPGITSGGTVTRLDGVALPLKQVTETKKSTTTTAQVITDLLASLGV